MCLDKFLIFLLSNLIASSPTSPTYFSSYLSKNYIVDDLPSKHSGCFSLHKGRVL